MKFLKLISLDGLFKLILALGCRRGKFLEEVTNQILLKDSWLQHLVRFLCKRPVIKAIRVTFYIKSYRLWAFPPPLVFQIFHVFQGQVTQQLQIYPQLQLTYCINLTAPWKGLKSVPNVLCSCPLNDSLVSFVIIMLTYEFRPLMLSHTCFRWLRSLHLLPWCINSLYTLHKV